MRIGPLILTILGVVLLVLAAVVGIAWWQLQQRPPGLSTHLGFFPAEQRPLIALLAREAEALEQVDPLGQPPQSNPLARYWQQRERAELQLGPSIAHKEYRIEPRGWDQFTEAEISAIHRAARAAQDAGIGIGDLLTLAEESQAHRMAQGFSVPVYALRGTQPVFRGALTGRALPNPALLERGRQVLRTALIPAQAPVDPLYPLAVAAATSAEGMGGALEVLSEIEEWDLPAQIQVAFGLGCLYWWSLEPDQAEFFAMLEAPSTSPPILRMAAMAGAVQGLNNILLADDQGSREMSIPFIEQWGATVEQPWVDQAAEVYAREQPGWGQFVLLGRCPSYRGYLERVAGWALSLEAGEQFMARAYFAQSGYVGHLATAHPDSMRALAARMPVDDPLFNTFFFYSYLDEVSRHQSLGSELWEPALRAGLRGSRVSASAMARVLGSPRGGDWTVLLPDIRTELMRLSQVTRPTELEDRWPFLLSPGIAAYPVPGQRDTDDPAFARAIDAELRRLWPGATPAFRSEVVRSHLGRLVQLELDLTPWLPEAAAIVPELGRINEPDIVEELRTVFGEADP